MLPKHQDCAECCERGRCHFCLQAARHAFDDGCNSFACCSAHLLWLASSEHAPGAMQTSLPQRTARLTLPADGIAAAVRVQPTNAVVGERLVSTLGSLEVPAILREPQA
jgi:hypothetical protein